MTKQLGIERRLSTAFHAQTDGQTERTNSTLEQYLRAYVNYQQDNWKELLPMAEFAYNKGYQESIKRTPFFANCGVNPEYQTIGHLMEGKITPAEDSSQLHDTLQADDGSTTKTQGILRSRKKARSESRIRRYGLAIAKEYTNDKAMQETGL